MGERIDHIATCKNLRPEEELLPHKEGGSNVDGDESGGTSPSRHGAGAGILVPRSLMAMAAEIGIASGEKGSRIRVSARRFKYMPKGGIGGASGGPGAPPARPGGGGGVPTGPLGPLWPPRPPFGSSVVPDMLIFYIFFLDFSGQFSKRENLKYKNSRKQKLALGCTGLVS